MCYDRTVDWTEILRGVVKGAALALDAGGRMADPFPVALLAQKFREHFGAEWEPREPDIDSKGWRIWFFPGCRYVAEHEGLCYFYRKPGTGPTKLSRFTDALGELWGLDAKTPVERE